MKKYKHKLLTLLSVLALGTSAAGMAFTGLLSASAESVTYKPTSVFSVSESAESASLSVEGTEYTAIEFKNEGKVTYRQDLAYRWFSAKGREKFFGLKLFFADKNFDTFTVTFESELNNKTKENKATNTVTFKNDGNKILIAVNDGEERSFFTDTLEITLSKGSTSGVYRVAVNDSFVGNFENVGGYYAEYASSKLTPLTFTATTKGEDVKTKVAILSMNEQSFALDADGNIEDTVAPVLVVNQSLSALRLGRTIALDYEVIDVLDATVSKDLQYYQYSPEDAEVKYETLSQSKIFFKKKGVENNYVSVKMTLNDDADHKTTYDLSWYADPARVTTIGNVDYLPLINDVKAPEYNCITVYSNVAGNKESELNKKNKSYLAYVDAVAEAAKNVTAGSGNYFYLPSLEDLVSDEETAYSSLTFNIYYKTQNSSSASSSTNLSSSSLSIQTTSAGYYKFRVVPADDSGNVLSVYQDGREVKVTSSNVWDLDCIPEFGFTAYNAGLTIDETKKQKSAFVEQEYKLSSFTIKGIAGYQTNYSLYYFEGADKDASLNYNKLVAMANEEKTAENPYGAFAKYLDASEGLYLRSIAVYDDSVSEKDAKWSETDNVYQWKGGVDSFVPQEAGYYVLVVEAIDSELWGDKVVGYQIIEVASEQDVVKGETYWLQNNYVSVIFFALAGVALIAIVVLLVVKPKEENIEELDLKKTDKKEKKSKKNEDLD